MRFEVQVEVQLLPGISDPEGATIERALPALGFTGVQGMRVGKAFRFGVEAHDSSEAARVAEELAQRLLSNPVMESAKVHVSQAAVDGASR